MTRWWWMILLLLSLGVNAGILGTLGAQRAAQRWGGSAEAVNVAGPPEMPLPARLPPVLHRLATELRLAGEGRRRFLELHRAFLRRTGDLRRRRTGLQSRLREELLADAPDRRKLGSLLDELAATNGDLERAFVDHLLAVRELLGPRQERVYMRFVGRLRQLDRHEIEGRRAPPRRGRRP